MGMRLHVLIAEGSDHSAESIEDALRSGGYDLAFERVDTSNAFTAALERQHWDVVFPDFAIRGISPTVHSGSARTAQDWR